jgi:hypothetical protein
MKVPKILDKNWTLVTITEGVYVTWRIIIVHSLLKWCDNFFSLPEPWAELGIQSVFLQSVRVLWHPGWCHRLGQYCQSEFSAINKNVCKTLREIAAEDWNCYPQGENKYFVVTLHCGLVLYYGYCESTAMIYSVGFHFPLVEIRFFKRFMIWYSLSVYHWRVKRFLKPRTDKLSSRPRSDMRVDNSKMRCLPSGL